MLRSVRLVLAEIAISTFALCHDIECLDTSAEFQTFCG
jgi:hypothetical protein